MNRLAAYGSDSEGSDSESAPVVVQTAAPRPQPVRQIPLPAKVVIPPPKEIPKEPSLNLPAASNVEIQPRQDSEKEDELDTTVLRKDWEIKLAEKEKKEFKKTKKKIDAFGGLSRKTLDVAANDDDFVQKPIQKPVPTTNAKSSLLSMLPPPKMSTVEKPKTSTLSFTPSTVKSTVKKPEAKKRKLDDEEESTSSSSVDNDFFGLGAVTKKDLLDARKIPRSEANLPNMFVVDEDIGPVKPQKIQESEKSETNLNMKAISNEEARKLIYQQEIEQWGTSSVFANDAVMNIVDVNVDKEIGPNVKETLLRNLDYKNVTAFAVGKPQKPISKDETQKLAKMKHQITHLAGLAVAREEQLKEQWAQNKAAKIASKQKYGF